jgi:diguanylate cyclase (GGDEF)-like protein
MHRAKLVSNPHRANMKTLVHLKPKPPPKGSRAGDPWRFVRRKWGDRHAGVRIPLFRGVVSAVLIAVVGWVALLHPGSIERSAIIVAGLVTVTAIIIRQEIVVRQSRLLTSHLTQQIDHDPLTGLANRRRIERYVDSELAYAKASGRALGLALIDIDNFKAVNDTHGHAAGDQVLKAIAGILARACRGSDIAARYAGDEFLLVLPSLDHEHAHIVGERLLKGVARYGNSVALRWDVEITVSIGIAVSRQCQKPARQLIALADAAMYDAKAAGKNQLVIVDADTKVLAFEGRTVARENDIQSEVVLPSAG